MKQKHLAVFILSMVMAFSGKAQMNTAKQKAMGAISKLSFLEGNWQGSFKFFDDGKVKATMYLTDIVILKNDRTVIQIEGSISKTKADTATNHALVLISYNTDTGKYISVVFTNEGAMMNGEISLLNNYSLMDKIYDAHGWYTKTTITVQNNNWTEVIETSKDGREWIKTIEENLQKSQP